MPEKDLDKKLREALEECERLRRENAELRAMLGLKAKEPSAPGHESEKRTETSVSPKPAIDHGSPSEAKVKLFRSLFSGRDDVYPVRWESRTGRAGYSPACAHEWDRVYCAKPKIKCSQCDHRELLPVTDRVLYDHLAGKHTIGLYPLMQDEKCLLLAVDFDKAAWREDAAAFMETCDALGVPAVLERSRSGNGGHVWIFFEQPVQASLARKLGCAVLCYTMNKRPELGLDSYDRLFPSQDTMPRGGFGSLIALPLQREPRASGNSVFLDRDFQPYKDQWLLLASVRKMNGHDTEALVSEAARTGNIIGVRMSVCEEDRDDDPWVSVLTRKRKKTIMHDPLPQSVRVVLGNMVFVEKDGLPPSAVNGITRLAAFQNPEFYRMQAMRMSTFNKPRVISCAEDFHRHIAVPRGCIEDLLGFLKESGTEPVIADERFAGRPIRASFGGALRPAKQQAVERIMKHDIGVLSAATAFGKTVVAARIIAERKVNTLVLVHRRQLMDQWKARLEQFLDLPMAPAPGQSEEETEAGDADADAVKAGKKKKGRKKRAKKIEPIGVIGGGKDHRTGNIDVGIIQSIVKKGQVKDLITEYGQVIIDECH
ncbi:MAG: DEAD/DEAH box helicase family protein, partial [Pseudomonadota bacterium]